jgi:hypothetical protein
MYNDIGTIAAINEARTGMLLYSLLFFSNCVKPRVKYFDDQLIITKTVMNWREMVINISVKGICKRLILISITGAVVNGK